MGVLELFQLKISVQQTIIILKIKCVTNYIENYIHNRNRRHAISRNDLKIIY